MSSDFRVLYLILGMCYRRTSAIELLPGFTSAPAAARGPSPLAPSRHQPLPARPGRPPPPTRSPAPPPAPRRSPPPHPDRPRNGLAPSLSPLQRTPPRNSSRRPP